MMRQKFAQRNKSNSNFENSLRRISPGDLALAGDDDVAAAAAASCRCKACVRARSKHGNEKGKNGAEQQNFWRETTYGSASGLLRLLGGRLLCLAMYERHRHERTTFLSDGVDAFNSLRSRLPSLPGFCG
jgi:hypothetical protein